MSETTEHPTLSEFLLARIGEDEVGTRPGTIRNAVFSGIMDHYNLDETDSYDQEEATDITNEVMTYLQPRVLAECEAKRRIVELWAWSATSPCALDPGHDCYEEAERHNAAIEGYDTLRALAAVCADAPDYREEWRP